MLLKYNCPNCHIEHALIIVPQMFHANGIAVICPSTGAQSQLRLRVELQKLGLIDREELAVAEEVAKTRDLQWTLDEVKLP